MTGPPHGLFRPVKVSTTSELYPDFFWVPTFLNWPGIQLFDTALSQHSPLGKLWLPTPYCETYWTLFHTIGHQILPTQFLSREAEYFLGVTIILSLCLYPHTYSDFNQYSKPILDWHLNMSKLKRR